MKRKSPPKPQKKAAARAKKKSAKAVNKAPAAAPNLGRPTDYRAEMCDQVRALGKQGLSKAQIARALDVGYSTIDTWAKKHADFSAALHDAYFLAMAHWEDVGASGVRLGMKFNATAFVFLMKNRFPREYRDKTEHQVTEIVAPAPLPDLNDIRSPKEMLQAFEQFRMSSARH